MKKGSEVELKHIKELMTAMGRTGTKRVNIKKGDFELTVERDDQSGYRFIDSSLDSPGESFRASSSWSRADQALSRGSEMPGRPHVSPVAEETPKADTSHLFVTSPMVGTFYAAPSPDDPPFIKVGDRVEKNTVVCIIEAMKVMNEIKANVAGTVAEILVETSQPVEFGSKLFRIIP